LLGKGAKGGMPSERSRAASAEGEKGDVGSPGMGKKRQGAAEISGESKKIRKEEGDPSEWGGERDTSF